jgi:hypothetical protein
MTNYYLWSQLGTTTKRAIVRRKKKFGYPYTYTPRGTLLKRLAKENGITIEQAYRQLMELRADLLRSDE